ncbi:cell division protein ZapE [Luteimonas huabeiensis]|uniref:cell division protein ZapE n=1 Tax=Luteimonas huabeiensis TaxID=1244513 RepID=UPI000463A8F3|nr:cell division protein ZapE [Luteimonas huabeiensis]
MSASGSPSQRYAAGVARGDWQDDPAQRAVLPELDRLHAALSQPPARRGALKRLFGRGDAPEAIDGLYLWGGVGRGKTFLIDLFIDALPLKELKGEALSGAPLPDTGSGGDRSQSERWGEGLSNAEALSGVPLPDTGRGGDRSQSERWGEGLSNAEALSGVPLPDTGRGGDRSQGERWGEGDGSAPAPADPRLGGKRRTHFHRFMRGVHEQLRGHAGERDPIAAVVRQWREAGLRVLALDEFFVTDIGDAMLLARLLERMFGEGIVLVTTSNIAPDGLYRDGLQRARFLPAIELLKAHCRVLEMASDTDYRLRALTRSPVYRTPLDAGAADWLAERWRALGGGERRRDGGIVVDGRRIAVRARAPGMAWFDFDALCEGPRGSADYIQIAREFHTVLVGGVPQFDDTRNDAARRFVTLVDELYDRHVNLVCTAAAEPPALYAGERLAATFERTASRLIEMRSAEYLARPHRP